MSYAITEIEGIGDSYGDKLAAVEIKNTDALLAKAATPSGRKALANQTGISEKIILNWTNMADLFRLKGVGPQYAELLEKAGVDTVKELRRRNAANLATKMAEVQATTHVAKRAPSEKEISGWITQASDLEPIISY